MKTLGRPSWPHWLTFSLLIGVALTIVSFLPSLLSSPISRLVIVLPGVLLTGWFHSMTRFVGALGSQFEFMVMICALVPAVFIGLHVFFRWLTRKQTWSKAHRWRVRWTICISGILASGLLVGMASIGVIHQIGWLVGTKGNVFNKPRGFSILHDADSLERATTETLKGGEVVSDEGQNSFRLNLPFTDREIRRFLSSYRCYLLADGEGRYKGIVLVGRDTSRPWAKPVQIRSWRFDAGMTHEEFVEWLKVYEGNMFSIVPH